MIAPLLTAALLSASPELVELPGFGKVPVVAPDGAPRRAVLLLSGAAGPNADSSALATALARDGALVAVVDTPALLAREGKRRCAYPAGDLEVLAQAVQKQRAVAEYLRPVLVGHSLGARVAYAAAVQAPAGTFRGAVLLGHCPDAPLAVHLCPGGPAPRRVAGGEVVPPWPGLEVPLALVQGADDAVCPAPAAQQFARGLPAASFATVPGTDHLLVPAERWARAVRAEIARVESVPPTAAARGGAGAGRGDTGPGGAPAAQDAPPPEVRDLPLVEVPAKGEGTRLAVMVSGDGGWVGLDKDVARTLSEAGVAVVGLDSLRYFWKRRTPDETARDVARILLHYRAAWRRPDLILVGYSRGADIVPFLPSRFPPDLRRALRLVAMLAPGTYAEFEFHVVDLFTSTRRSEATSTEAAVKALGGEVKLLCVQGVEENDSLCPLIGGRPEVERVVLPGAHHFDRDYPKLARMILDAAGESRRSND